MKPIIPAILLLFFLSGCAMLSSEQKLECASLATIPQASIPDCQNPDSCKKILEEKLKIEKFGEPFVDEELKKWENSVSMSWTYYGKAKNTLKEISQSCQSSSQANLVQKTNELGFYLEKTIEYLQEAQKNQYAEISLQEARLRKEKIGQIKEEKLYSKLTELNEILNQSPNSQNQFLKKTRHANSELNGLFLGSESWKFRAEITERDLLEEMLPEVLKDIRPTTILITLGKQAAKKASEKLNNSEKLQDSLQEMGIISAEKTSKAIESFIGLENSTAAEFQKLMQEQKNEELQLEKENSQRLQNTEELLKNNSEKIQKMLASNLLETDTGLLEKIMQELGIESKIQLRKNEFQNISDFQKNALEKNQELEELIKKEKTLKKTIGEKTKSAKELEKQANSISKEIELLEKESFEKTISACKEKAGSITKNAAILKNQDEFLLQDLQNNALKTKESQGKPALQACGKMLADLNEIQEKSANQEKFLTSKETSAKNCMEELERTKASKMQSISEKFEVLQKLMAAGIAMEKASIECEKLKEQAMQEANEKTREEQELFANAKQKQAALNNPGKETSAKIKELEKYFKQDLENTMLKASLKEQIKENLEELINQLNAAIENEAVEKIQDSAKIEAISERPIEANKQQKTAYSLILESDENLQNQQIKISQAIEGKIKPNELLEKVEKDKNQTLLFFKKIPKGTTIIEFEEFSMPATTDEKTENTFCNEEKAIFERKITIHTKESAEIPDLKIKTTLPENSSLLFAESEQKEIPAKKENDEITLELKNAKNNQSSSVWFQIDAPIEKTIELIMEKDEMQKTIQEYSLTVKNRSGTVLKNARINLDFLENADKITAVDEFGREKKVKKNYSTELVEEQLPPIQEKRYKLRAEFAKDSFDWKTIISQTKQITTGLSKSEIWEISQKARELLEKTNFLSENFSEQNKQDKQEALNYYQKAKELEAEQKRQEIPKERAQQQAAKTEELPKQEARQNDQNSISKAQLARMTEFIKRAELAIKNRENALSIAELLSKNLQNFGAQEMLESKYLPPITKEEIEKAKLDIQKMNFSKIGESLQKIKDLNSNGIINSSEVEKTIEESQKALDAVEKINEIKQALESKASELKIDAQTILEKESQKLQEKANGNEKAKFLLEKAAKELENKNYIKSIQYAGFANALVSLNHGIELPDLPMALIPLAGLIAIALLLKKKREKSEIQKQERIKKILRKESE
ncbi:MAG: hypothetical protein Q7R70_03065 [Candidatus Diapherotrites archaeon]|nr:hypothetical protein [Candidatus Diapherotrites archaeon]